MPQTALYDEDVLLWSEQQAEIVRNLGRTRRDLPNEFDLENVAEEIESVGRSELASVESLLVQVMGHLIKSAIDPDSLSMLHWRQEIATFRLDARRRYAPSMRQRIDVEAMWADARHLAEVNPDLRADLVGRLPKRSPFSLDEVMQVSSDPDTLIERLRELVVPPGTPS